MQASPVRDLAVGLFVLVGLAALGYLTFQVGGLSYRVPGGLQLVAVFDDIGGLKERAPVTISGVKVGQVSAIELDTDEMRAEVVLDLDESLEIPGDTWARIRTSGLLGDQFVLLEPGNDSDILRPGEAIAYTESALSLEALVGKFLNNTELEDD